MDIDLISYWRELSKDNKELSNAFVAQGEEESIPPLFFRYFRPTGIGLKPYFNGLPHGTEIYNRMRKIYDATSNSDSDSEFFVIENPPILTKDELVNFGKKYIQSIKDTFTLLNMPDFLSQNISTHIIKGIAPKIFPLPKNVKRIFNVPEGEHYEGDLQNAAEDIKGWFLGEFDVMSTSLGYCLSEGIFNMLEPDYKPHLDAYILYPLIADDIAKYSAMGDPYSIEFDLWKYNARTVFFDDKTLHIYVNDYVV